MAEEARLESVYTSKAYPEFESRSLRNEAGTRHGDPPRFLSPSLYRFPSFDHTLKKYMLRVPNNVLGWHVADWQVEDLHKASGLDLQ